MIRVPNDRLASVLSFVRQHDDDKVFGVFNLSPDAQTVRFRETLCHGAYTDFETGERIEITDDTAVDLGPWAYRVLLAPTGFRIEPEPAP